MIVYVKFVSVHIRRSRNECRALLVQMAKTRVSSATALENGPNDDHDGCQSRAVLPAENTGRSSEIATKQIDRVRVHRTKKRRHTMANGGSRHSTSVRVRRRLRILMQRLLCRGFPPKMPTRAFHSSEESIFGGGGGSGDFHQQAIKDNSIVGLPSMPLRSSFNTSSRVVYNA